MIPFFAQMDTSDAMTTFGGIGIAILSIVAKDFVRDRLAGKNEKMKVSELSQQTTHLEQLVDLAKKARKQTKKANRKIHKKLVAIHKDVVAVKIQTTPNFKEQRKEKHTSL
ncbi:MAG TPA: hypothetical protein VGY56_11255 [Verrucomicrobiae bacterium]|nr:hypothetical protein [Verrucomicrobiae bacterium]